MFSSFKSIKKNHQTANDPIWSIYLHWTTFSCDHIHTFVFNKYWYQNIKSRKDYQILILADSKFKRRLAQRRFMNIVLIYH